jgi:hypothetical protein
MATTIRVYGDKAKQLPKGKVVALVMKKSVEGREVATIWIPNQPAQKGLYPQFAKRMKA